MEKVVAVLWPRTGEDRNRLNERVLSTLVPALRAAGATGVRANLIDDTVAAASRPVQRFSDPPPDAVVQFWLTSANAMFRGDVDAALETATGRFALYVVAESVVIPSPGSARSPTGQRSEGWSQVALLPLPPRLTREEFLTAWQDHHTQVAIDTQATFEYVQNTVVRCLTPGGPPYVAIVEESFPLQALHDPRAFFDARGDRARLEANVEAMMASCDRFIDRGVLDVLTTSQFDVA